MKKVRAVIIFIVAPILIGLYLLGGFYYKDRFPKNTYVNEINIGKLTVAKADTKLEKVDLWDKITIKSDSEEFLEIDSDEIDYKYISTPALDEILSQEKEENWLLANFNESQYTKNRLYYYDEARVKSMIDGIKEFDKELLDAKIVYSSESDTFLIEPHSYEIKITKEELFDLVDQAIENKDEEINIEKHIEQPSIFEDNKELIESKDRANKYLGMEIKYDFGNRKEILDGSILKDFIVFQGTELDLDPEKVKEYVADLARKYDTFGRNRKFKTSKGNIITTNGGSYGWMTHRGKTAEDLIEHIKSGEDKTIEPIYSFEALRRNSNDVGNSYVEIDLEDQMVYVYIDGQLKVKTETVTGNTSKGNDTPTGVYPINYKERDATLVGENYESPVKYWMPFNKNVGLHDADWRDEFGGDLYLEEGSNGCVNLPPNRAKNIFDLVYPGMPVIVH